MSTSMKQKHGFSRAGRNTERNGLLIEHQARADQSLQKSRGTRQPSQQPRSHPSIFTIGHGTRQLPNLIQLLQSAHVTKLVDVRSFPRSFTNPQFNHDNLQQSTELREAQIDYAWFGASLGGRRNRQQPNIERNSAIRVTAFRNYAGYMSTPAFRVGLEALKSLADTVRDSTDGYVAIMCSETLWWRCHRRMIADALVAEGWDVRHLGIQKQPMEHELWEIARIDDDGNVVYDVSV